MIALTPALDARRLAASKARFRASEASAMALSARSLRAAAAAQRQMETESGDRQAEDSGLFLRSVRDLRRIHSHLASFAYPTLHRRAGDAKGASGAPATVIAPATGHLG